MIKDNCVAVPINGHMLYWLMKTDGENGAFIKANRHPSNSIKNKAADGSEQAVFFGGGLGRVADHTAADAHHEALGELVKRELLPERASLTREAVPLLLRTR